VGFDKGQEKGAEPSAWMAHVTGTEAGVDQDQAGIGFDQQAVAGEMTSFHQGFRLAIHQLAGERAGGDAVEMMDSHGLLESLLWARPRAKPVPAPAERGAAGSGTDRITPSVLLAQFNTPVFPATL